MTFLIVNAAASLDSIRFNILILTVASKICRSIDLRKRFKKNIKI